MSVAALATEPERVALRPPARRGAEHGGPVRRPPALSAGAAAALQRTAGNRAVAALAGRRALQRTDCDPPKKEPTWRKSGEGKAMPTEFNEYGPVIGELKGDQAWILYNYDIDEHFTKKVHRDYVKTVIVPELKRLIEHEGAYVAVIGEASRTATQEHNLPLSQRRADCVVELLKQELGPADAAKIIHQSAYGKALAELRRPPDESEENEEDRRVAIVPVDRPPHKPDEPCPRPVKLRASTDFRVKVACNNPASVAINIGDVSVKDSPTYREFMWLERHPPGDDCRLRATDTGDAANRATAPLRLATGNPDSATAGSSFFGDATLDIGSGVLEAAGGAFTLVLDGTWTPKSCATSGGELSGNLVPIGPVKCGEVPMPPRGADCDAKEGSCSVADRTRAADEFGAFMIRVGHDIPIPDYLLDKLPAAARALVDRYLKPGATVAVVRIGTKDDAGPRIARWFFFGGVDNDASGWSGQPLAIVKDVKSDRPMRLSTKNPDEWLSPSDFDSDVASKSPSPAKLVVNPHSNLEELHVGGMTFTFHGLTCHASGRSILGVFSGIAPVACSNIAWETFYEPGRDCSEDCPSDQQLAGHKDFVFKIGRATTADMPVLGKRLADRYGCEVVGAYVNIGTVGGEPIHRKYVFVGRLRDPKATGADQPCDFTVARGAVPQKFLFERHLSKKDPDALADLSDFTGVATLDGAGTLNVKTATATPFSLKLPGAFDASCKGARGATGVLVPYEDVDCGEAPDPPHETAAEPSALEVCRDYKDRGPHKDLIEKEIAKLHAGDYNGFVDRLLKPGLFYHEPLDTLADKKLQTINPAVFVGRNHAGVKVITFVAMRVERYTVIAGREWVRVRFLSDPCSYDEYGNPVYVMPLNCMEALPYRGMVAPLRPVPMGTAVPDPGEIVPDPDMPPGGGQGSRTG